MYTVVKKFCGYFLGKDIISQLVFFRCCRCAKILRGRFHLLSTVYLSLVILRVESCRDTSLPQFVLIKETYQVAYKYLVIPFFLIPDENF